MGGDIVGEAWGKSKERVEIPINNYKDTILRTVLDLVESPKPLLAICWTIFSRFK